MIFDLSMRVLIVCSYRDFRPDGINAYIKEQVEAITQVMCDAPSGKCKVESVKCEFYLVRGKGVSGYIREIPKLRKVIRAFKPDIIHAHYGLCGLLANLSTRRIPVVTTYHGSDINVPRSRRYSNWSLRLSAWNIFVSQHLLDAIDATKYQNTTLIPCGVDLMDDQLQSREEARKALGWSEDEKKVLFAGMFEEVKGPELAMDAIARVNIEELRVKSGKVELIEMKGYTREEVNRLMCAVDCLLMTSKSEGSPQVIKEAMACGCPIVSVDVGDVAERVNGVDGCYVVGSYELTNERISELVKAIQKAFAFNGKTKGREKIITDGLDNAQIAERIIKIYERLAFSV